MSEAGNIDLSGFTRSMEDRVRVLESRVGSPGKSGLEKAREDLKAKIDENSRTLVGIYGWAENKADPAFLNHRRHIVLLWTYLAIQSLGLIYLWVTR